MKRLTLCVLLLAALALCGAALAEQPPVDITTLPGGARYADHEVVRFDSFSGAQDESAQVVLHLRNGGENVLCVLEKAAEDTMYSIVLANGKALYPGERTPSLTLDNAGGAIFYTYQDTEGDLVAESYSAVRTADGWSAVSCTLFYAKEPAEHWEWGIWPNNGALSYERIVTDGNDNILLREAPIHAFGWPTEQFLLESFDITALPKDVTTAQARGMASEDGEAVYERDLQMENGPTLRLVLAENPVLSGPDTIYISHAQLNWGGVPVQEFPIGLEVDAQLLRDTPDYAVILEDVNFDGTLDLRILSRLEGQNTYFRYWLWDTANARFVANDQFDALEANASFDAATGQILCMTVTDMSHFSDYIYVIAEGVPVLMEQIDTEYVDNVGYKRRYGEKDGLWQMVEAWTE